MMNVLLVGGSETWRSRMAEAFHRESPVHDGPVVRVDGRREEEQLARALLGWIGSTGVDPSAHPLRAASRGTLFVDWITCLSEGVQRLLLMLALREPGDRGGGVDGWCGRIVVGSPVDPAHAVARGEFSCELFDALDKIRIQHRRPGSRSASR
jgi:DNA-binding NtrC family response regulator